MCKKKENRKKMDNGWLVKYDGIPVLPCHTRGNKTK